MLVGDGVMHRTTHVFAVYVIRVFIKTVRPGPRRLSMPLHLPLRAFIREPIPVMRESQ